MSDTIIVALVSFAATLITSMGGYKLIAYRVEQLEKKVEQHNSVVSRTCILEEKIGVANHRIADLEDAEKRRSA